MDEEKALAQLGCQGIGTENKQTNDKITTPLELANGQISGIDKEACKKVDQQIEVATLHASEAGVEMGKTVVSYRH